MLPPHSTPPRSTYRLQISRDFTLHAAARLIPYLAELGVGAVYLSPLLSSTVGSMHGYDVVDHGSVDADRGGDEGLRAVVKAADEHGLGIVVDIVPNHMGVADPSQNPAWWELLRLGAEAITADWFDVEWGPDRGLTRIRIPVLGDDFDADRDLSIAGDELRYYEHRYPIAPGTHSAGDTPRDVHDRQHYELISYRLADTTQNYRRFFAVSDLAGLRVEDPEVFDATHREILRWVREYGVAGIRIDHPDGLVDPAGYLGRLAAAALDTWITVEKITEPGESLPAEWPVAGMTGYDALAEVNSVLIDPAAEQQFTELYRGLTGDPRSWEEHVTDGKRHVVDSILQAEIRRLGRLVPDIENATAALTELVIAFGVYRSYLPIGSEYLDAAARTARRLRPDLGPAIDSLLVRLIDPSDELCRRFQQTTGAAMAKGVEDTAYYRYSRLIGLNEVGGYPGTFGLTPSGFHAAQRRRQSTAAMGMTTLSTHDTKRGEDIRARLAVLPELTEDWAVTAERLASLAPIPSKAFGYLLWQTVAATGLIERKRIHDYARKAMREASDGTGWTDPDADFENRVHEAIDRFYDNPELRALISDFARRLDPHGRSNSLSAKLIQLTMPGIPDVYQGTELWEASLVDPDNRRPIDFGRHITLLNTLVSKGDPLPVDDTGVAKLWITRQALHARRDRPELFRTYSPLEAEGSAAEHLLAFDRGGSITVATRLPVGLERAGGWRDTRIALPEGVFQDVLSGRSHSGTVDVSNLLANYPVGLLLKGLV